MTPAAAPIHSAAIPPDRLAAAARPLPGMAPVAPGEWLCVDDAYGAQLAEKARLIAADRGAVIAAMPEAGPAIAELYETVLAELALRPDFAVSGGRIRRPDGVVVTPDPDDPLLTLSRLCQEDFCLHLRFREEHVLVGGILCFPAAWTLSEKVGRTLGRIHGPVPRYDHQVGLRVQRLFDLLHADRPIWRANLLRYDLPDLFQPHTEANPRPVGRPGSPWLRSERQVLRKLPESGAVVFSIHTALAPNPDAGQA